jgi:AbrB family looped-hinge helix DNA binding protein
MPNEPVRVTMGPNGRLLVPVELRDAMGLAGGGELILEPQEDGTLLLLTPAQAVRRVQAWAARFHDPEGLTATAALQAMRNEDAALEEDREPSGEPA